jgi:hypothetical protein
VEVTCPFDRVSLDSSPSVDDTNEFDGVRAVDMIAFFGRNALLHLPMIDFFFVIVLLVAFANGLQGENVMLLTMVLLSFEYSKWL